MATKTIEQIMTKEVVTIGREDTLQAAAQQMRALNVGALPVVDGDALVGIITDRDIAVRGVAEGMSAETSKVAHVMTHDVKICEPGDSVETATAQMGESQIRRMPVVDAARKVVGIVALADLATRQPEPTDEVLREISQPAPRV